MWKLYEIYTHVLNDYLALSTVEAFFFSELVRDGK